MPPRSAVFSPGRIVLIAFTAVTVAWLALREENQAPATQSRRTATAEPPASVRESPRSVSAGMDADPVLTGLEAKIADTARRLGPEHSRTLELRTKLGRWHQAQGRFAEAEAEHRAVLGVRMHTLGTEHPGTLTSRKFLGAALFSQGKYTAARAQYDALLSVRSQTGEIDRPEWPQTWREVAPLWFPKRTGSESQEVYLSALDHMVRVLLLDHPESAPGLSFPTVILDHLGRHAEAEKHHLNNHMARVRGPEEPDTLRARHYLDTSLNGQGRYADVEANERDILAIQQRVLGHEHEDVFATRLFLATSLRDQERYEEARSEAAIAYDGFQKLHGPDDPATLSARRLLDDIIAPR